MIITNRSHNIIPSRAGKLLRGAGLGLSTICAALLISCAQKEETIPRPAPENAVFRAGDQTVTMRDLMLTFQETSDFSHILQAASLEEADSASLPQGIETKRVNDILLEMAKQIAFEAHLAERARSNGLDETDDHIEYIDNILKEELYQKILLEDVLRGITITERDVQRFYQENREALFLKPGTNIFRARGIYIFTQPPHRSRDEAIQRAQAAYRELQEGSSFESVAFKYSDAPIHQRGQITHLPPEQIADPRIDHQLRNLQPGEYSEVFEGRNSDRLYIFQLEEFVPPEYIPFEEARPRVRQLIFNERRNQGIYFLSERLQRKHNSLVNYGLMDIDEPDAEEAKLTLLSVPGVYELTLGEFHDMAKSNRLWTRKERENYLTILSNKAVYLAEAISRGWGREQVEPAVSVWERKRLAEAYIQSLAEMHVFTEEEIRETYETNRNSSMFFTSSEMDLAYLFFPVEYSPLMSVFQRNLNFQQAERRAQRALDEMRSGLPFLEAAMIFPEEDVVHGGRIGRVATAEMRRSMHNFLSQLQPGEISKPEQVFDPNHERYGYELFHLRDVRPSRPLSFEEARQVIVQVGERGKYSEILSAYQRRFFEENPPQPRKEALLEAGEYLKTIAQHPDWQVDITYYAETL